MKLSRRWLAGILTVVAAALLALLPVSAGAFTLSFNDRWDSNSAKAHWIRDIGGTEARVFVSVTRSADPSYWNFLAGEVGNLRAAGVQPTWVLSDIPSYGGCNTSDLSLWRAAARALITRYPSGAIEIENEPNWTGNTSGACSEYPGWTPDLYAKVFKSTSRAIRAEQPNRTIVSAGLAPVGGWQDWLKRFVSLTRGLTYACGLHVYGTSVDAVVSDYQAAKTICGGRDVRVTEIGVSRVWVGAEGQAQLLPAEIQALLDRGVTYVVIHEMFETPYLEGFSMLDPTEQPYPVYYAIQAMMTG